MIKIKIVENRIEGKRKSFLPIYRLTFSRDFVRVLYISCFLRLGVPEISAFKQENSLTLQL